MITGLRAMSHLVADYTASDAPAQYKSWHQDGRLNLQVVGSTVSLAFTVPMSFQPQPVFSSSNFAPGSSGPKLAMYMSWKNWWSSRRIHASPPSNASIFISSSLAAIARGSSDFASRIAWASMRIWFTTRGYQRVLLTLARNSSSNFCASAGAAVGHAFEDLEHPVRKAGLPDRGRAAGAPGVISVPIDREPRRRPRP